MKSVFKIVASLALSIAAVSALPSVEKRAITPALFSTLRFYAYYAQAPYCVGNDALVPRITAPRTLECGNNACGPISGNSEIYFGLPASSTNGPATGFVAVDNTTQRIIVSFRGTANVRELPGLLVRFTRTVPLSYFPACTGGCEFASEVDTQWSSIRLEVFQIIRELLLSGNTKNTVVFVGHSLGAAVATLAATDFRANFRVTPLALIPPPSVLYSYASPRLFNRAAATYAQGLSTENYRVTHYKDDVVRTPRANAFTSNHEHIGPEYYISAEALASENALTVTRVEGPTSPINPLEGTTGSLQWGGRGDSDLLSSRQVGYHRNYLIPLSTTSCTGQASEEFSDDELKQLAELSD